MPILQVLLVRVLSSKIVLSGHLLVVWAFFNVFKEIYDNRWTPETAGAAKYPVVTDGFNVQSMRRSTVWQKDASYLRLKNLEVGYTLPKKL